MAATWSRTVDDRAVLRVDGAVVAVVPRDQGNADYQAFLAWSAAGGDPGPLPPTPALPITDINRAAIVDQLRTAWADLGTYLALGAASTAAQDKAAVRLMARTMRGVLRLTVGKLDGTD